MDESKKFCSHVGCKTTNCPYHQTHMIEVTPPAVVDICRMRNRKECPKNCKSEDN